MIDYPPLIWSLSDERETCCKPRTPDLFALTLRALGEIGVSYMS